MFAVPSIILYRSRTKYQQLWISTQKDNSEKQFVHQHLERRSLVPRREVELLDQVQIQQVLHDIREAQDKIEKEPKILLSRRMIYLRKQRKGMRKQKNIYQYHNRVPIKNDSFDFTEVEI